MPGLTQAPGGESTTLETQDAFLLQRNGTDFWAERQNVLAFPQDWVVSRPVNKEERILAAANFGSKAQMVTEAITYAKDNGGGHIVVSRNLPPWDVSAVTHDTSVIHYIAGQDEQGYNVRAYGAAADNLNDDHPAFQKAHDQADLASGGANAKILVPEPQPFYRLGSQWLLTTSSLTVQGSGKFSCRVLGRSNFDSTQHEALVQIGDGNGGAGSQTSSVTFEGFHLVAGQAGEVSALKFNFWFSGTVRNCKLKGGDYNVDGLGRETACLHVRGGKNLFVQDNEMATTGAYGVLLDDRGDSGNNFNDILQIEGNQISECPGNIVIKSGAVRLRVLDNRIGLPFAAETPPASNHNIFLEFFRSAEIRDNIIQKGKYGVVWTRSKRVTVEDNHFSTISRQAIVDDSGRKSFDYIRNNSFTGCGTDHVEGGTISGDYTTTNHIADIHIRRAHEGATLLKGNVHKNQNLLSESEARDKYSAIVNADGTQSIANGPNFYCEITNNGPLPSGYRAMNGDDVHGGQTHYMDENGTRFNGRMKGIYTGNGTTGRAITLGFRPNKVLVEDSSGTLYEVRDDGLSPIDGTAPTGVLSITDDGFEVGDDGSDADPNTDTETYSYVAVE